MGNCSMERFMINMFQMDRLLNGIIVSNGKIYDKYETSSSSSNQYLDLCFLYNRFIWEIENFSVE